MNLNQIQLPEYVFNQLYPKCIVQLSDKLITDKKKHITPIKYLGQNKENITIVTKSFDNEFLSDVNLTFLIGILTACKLKISDVALLNLHKTPAINLTLLCNDLSPRIIMLFDILPSDLPLPLNLELLQAHENEGIKYLSAPSLTVLEKDTVLKKEFWQQLKNIFYL